MKIPKASRLLPIVICAVVLMRCSCDFFGTTGALLVSEQDEVKLGTQFDTHLRTNDTAKAEYPLYVPKTADEIAFQEYVTGLAKSILAKIPAKERPDYPFTFTLIDKNVENAFAVPGGYVYLYTGIISKMRDESELVGVLSHEIAHVTRHHYRDAMAKDAGLSIILQALLGNDAGQLAQLVAGSFFQLAALTVSRGNESDADFYGTKYTGSMLRNPLGIAKFFGRFPDGGPPSWISTHPKPDDRVGDVTDQVNDDPVLKALSQDPATNFQTEFELKTKVIPKT
jgi:beta-barrel assembly-enhancing protease